MEWNGRQLKNLRMRLGWSISDLSRRLGCPVEDLQKWEQGASIDSEYIHFLNHLLLLAEDCGMQLSQRSQAEKKIKEEKLYQVHREDLLNDNE